MSIGGFARDRFRHRGFSNQRKTTTINRDALCAAGQGEGQAGCADASPLERLIRKSGYHPWRSPMRTVTIALMVAIVFAAFAIKFEVLHIFWRARKEVFRPDELTPWMVRVIVGVAIVGTLLGFYFAWRYPSR